MSQRTDRARYSSGLLGTQSIGRLIPAWVALLPYTFRVLQDKMPCSMASVASFSLLPWSLRTLEVLQCSCTKHSTFSRLQLEQTASWSILSASHLIFLRLQLLHALWIFERFLLQRVSSMKMHPEMSSLMSSDNHTSTRLGSWRQYGISRQRKCRSKYRN